MAKEAARVRRRERKNITSGVAHVNATFNNTMITITDAQGNAISWSSAGAWASRARASRPRIAAQMAAEDAAKKAQEHGMRTLEVEVCGPGSGRESALRALQAGWLHDHLDPRRDADPAQWLPPAQAAPRLIYDFDRRASAASACRHFQIARHDWMVAGQWKDRHDDPEELAGTDQAEQARDRPSKTQDADARSSPSRWSAASA